MNKDIKQLLEDYKPLIKSVCRSPLQAVKSDAPIYLSKEEREDLESEIVLKFIELVEKYEPKKSRFSYYIEKNIKWFAFNYVKERLNLNINENKIEYIEELPEELFVEEINEEKKELIKLLHEALPKLTERQMQVVSRYYFEKKPMSIIAKEINMDIRNVDRNLKLAVKKLRKILDKRLPKR